MEVATELEVVDALLQLNKDVIKLHVELRTLLEQDGELVLDDDGLVDGLEELALGWVGADLGAGCIQAGGV